MNKSKVLRDLRELRNMLSSLLSEKDDPLLHDAIAIVDEVTEELKKPCKKEENIYLRLGEIAQKFADIESKLQKLDKKMEQLEASFELEKKFVNRFINRLFNLKETVWKLEGCIYGLKRKLKNLEIKLRSED